MPQNLLMNTKKNYRNKKKRLKVVNNTEKSGRAFLKSEISDRSDKYSDLRDEKI